MGENPIVLSTEALCKSFGSLEVARNVTIDLPRGARYALIGPNGAGKTTLINLITGELRPDSGRIVLDGHDVTGITPAARVRNGLARTPAEGHARPVPDFEEPALRACPSG